MKPRYVGRFAKQIVETLSRAFAGRKSRPDIFISATSADLGSVRKIVRDALLDSDCFPVEQSHFSPDFRKVEEMLRAKISNCQAMIHLVGMRYGFEPRADSLPPDVPRRSYTQMEYHMAKELGIRCYVFVCPEDFPYDQNRVVEPQDKQELQLAHRRSFLESNTVFTEFEDRVQLKESVLRLQKELAELSERVDQNRLRLWLAVLLNWSILLVVGGGMWWGVRQVADFRHEVVKELKRDISPERLKEQAAEHFDNREYAAAFHAYAQLSDADPGNLSLHRRVEECARMGHLEKPFLARYLARVQQHPANAVFNNYLGNAYLMLDPKDTEGKGRRCYETAIRLDPRLSPPMANLGILCFRAGNSGEAEIHFRNYLALQPDDAQAWVNLGLLYLARVQANTNDAKAVDASVNALNKAIQIDPGAYLAYKALGRLFLTLGRTNESRQAYQTSIKLNPDQPDVRQKMAEQSWDAGPADSPASEAVTRGD